VGDPMFMDVSKRDLLPSWCTRAAPWPCPAELNPGANLAWTSLRMGCSESEANDE
jgi:hypothetical protein